MIDRIGTEEPTDQEVLRQLGQVLDSPDFRASPRLRQLLQFLVETRVADPNRVLSGRDIAAGVFRRTVDFRNGEDSIVRSSVNRMRRVLAVYYATRGRDDDVRICVEPGNYTPAFMYHENKNPSGPERAVAKAERYLHVATKKSHSAALGLIRRALEREPENALLLASFADLSLDAYKHGHDRTYAHVDAACIAIEKAVSVAPEDNRILLARAMLSLEIADRATLSKCTDKLLNSPDDNDALLGMWFSEIGADYAGSAAGDPGGLSVQATSPGWYHLPEYLRHTLAGDHEAALNSAIEFSMPGFFWGSTLRASALGHLGLREAGRRQRDIAYLENPDLRSRTEDYLACYIISEDSRAAVIEGLGRLEER